MTVFFLSIATALSVLLAMFMGDLATASSLDARAQAAADAAALAAIAESGPYGSSSHEAAARRWAGYNDAELLECDCKAGAAEVQVTVALDGAVARARAELDPELLAPLSMGFDRSGLHPGLSSALDELLAAAGGTVHVVSGYRSAAEQASLWIEAVRRHGSAEAADDWVARPGSSMHERGLAVDLGGDPALVEELVRELGLPLYRPLPNESWHWELLGSRG